MIFVTVGSNCPFDRLIRAVDAWAAIHRQTDIFAQTGHGNYTPQYVDWVDMLEPGDFRACFAQADAIVSHAGTGTILMARDLGKRIVVMPRRACLRETRSDHQVGTARHLAEAGLVTMAADEHELPAKLDRISEIAGPKMPPTASTLDALIVTIRSFVQSA